MLLGVIMGVSVPRGSLGAEHHPHLGLYQHAFSAVRVVVISHSEGPLAAICRTGVLTFQSADAKWQCQSGTELKTVMARGFDDFCSFGIVICDESHALKTHSAKRTQFIWPLVQKAKHAILITGTPALSRPIELFPQVQFSIPKPRLVQRFGATVRA